MEEVVPAISNRSNADAEAEIMHKLVAFDDILERDNLRRARHASQVIEDKAMAASTSSPVRVIVPVRKIPLNSPNQGSRTLLYDRIVLGKPSTNNNTPTKSPVKEPSTKSTVMGWFSKESAEERAIRSKLKSYKTRLGQEIILCNKAVLKYRKKTLDQSSEYDKQERQLISWGLKAALPKFHMQAWYRMERCRIYENLSTEIANNISSKHQRISLYLQQFEESKNRREKFSLAEVEEICPLPEQLILRDSSVLHLQERLRRMDLLCSSATRSFVALEPEFAWKNQHDRKEQFYRILQRYQELPKYEELENIESSLSWVSFVNWMSDRNVKLRKTEQDFFDFIEDEREVEGRLFHRWQTCVLLHLQSTGEILPPTNNTSNNNNVSSPSLASLSGTTIVSDALKGNPSIIGHNDGINGDIRQARPNPLKVTSASIRAFIRYFASDIVGIKYNVDKTLQPANIALTEALFYRRIGCFVFRYVDPEQRKMDEVWRYHIQRCRFVDPRTYSVPEKYLIRKIPPPTVVLPDSEQQQAQNEEDETTVTSAATSLGTGIGQVSPAMSRSPTDQRLRMNLESFVTSPPIVEEADDDEVSTQIMSPVSLSADLQDEAMQSVQQIPQPPPVASSSSSPQQRSHGKHQPLDQSAGGDLKQSISSENRSRPSQSGLSLSFSARQQYYQKRHQQGMINTQLPCSCYYCQTLSLSQRLQRLPHFEDCMLGRDYSRSIRVLSWLGMAVTPRETAEYLSLACKWILRDAIDTSGSRSIIGADTMVPLFTMVLIHAQIPNIHMLLRILVDYGEYDEQGDVSYNIANLEGSMMFIMQQLEVTPEALKLFSRYNTDSADPRESASNNDTARNEKKRPSYTSNNKSRIKSVDISKEDAQAMEELGEWLRDQKTMEDTIAILQSDGWML